MNYTIQTKSPEQSVTPQTQSESPEREDHGGESSRSAEPGVAKLSCDNCRRRKVKCNRQLPSCSLCVKLNHDCTYSSARKRPVRRTRYSELEERLKQMEKVLVEGKSADQDVDITPSRQIPPILSRVPEEPSDNNHAFSGDLVISQPRIVDPCFAWDIPEKGLIEPLDDVCTSLFPAHGTDEDPANFICGSLNIFSGRGVAWIDQLLDNKSFSTMVKGIQRPDEDPDQNLGLIVPSTNLLPSHKLAESSVQGFFSTINIESPLFQEEVIASHLSRHQAGTQVLEVGYIASINILVAFQKFQCFPIRYKVDTDVYLGNALALIPRLMMEGASSLNTGALLCIALYFIFATECERATSVLGLATQMMINAGYNTKKHGSDPEVLFQQRLFWHAYVMSSDVSLYLGKAPAVWDELVSHLPEEHPDDRRGDLNFQDGTILNVMYHRFALARIRWKVWTMLHSPRALELPHHQIYQNVIELEHELDLWKANIPGITADDMYDAHEGKLVYLGILHMRYYQLVISIHSVLFTRASGPDPHVRKMKAAPSVARCVQAARDAVSLLGYFNKGHPFMGLLCPNVAWCCDVLCIHILQNKNILGVYEDIARLEKVAKIFEKFAEEYSNKLQSQVANMLYFIAAYGVRQNKALVQQPAEEWYANDYVQVPVSAPPKYEHDPIPLSAPQQHYTPPINVPLEHQFADYPMLDPGIQHIPPYPDDGMNINDPAVWLGVGFEPTQAGPQFFIHS